MTFTSYKEAAFYRFPTYLIFNLAQVGKLFSNTSALITPNEQLQPSLLLSISKFHVSNWQYVPSRCPIVNSNSTNLKENPSSLWPLIPTSYQLLLKAPFYQQDWHPLHLLSFQTGICHSVTSSDRSFCQNLFWVQPFFYIVQPKIWAMEIVCI